MTASFVSRRRNNRRRAQLGSYQDNKIQNSPDFSGFRRSLCLRTNENGRKRIMSLRIVSGFALLFALGAVMMAQGARELTATETTTTKATIVAIDKANRIVTLRTPKGEDWTVYADERV